MLLKTNVLKLENKKQSNYIAFVSMECCVMCTGLQTDTMT